MMENLIENFNEVITYLKNKEVLYILNNGHKCYFIYKNDKIFVYDLNVSYRLKLDDFIDLYHDNKFHILEEEDEGFDFLKDDEYYSWKHK